MDTDVDITVDEDIDAGAAEAKGVTVVKGIPAVAFTAAMPSVGDPFFKGLISCCSLSNFFSRTNDGDDCRSMAAPTLFSPPTTLLDVLLFPTIGETGDAMVHILGRVLYLF